MPYLLTGRVRCELSETASEPLPEVTVRFYRLPPVQATEALAAAILKAEEIAAKHEERIGQAWTDESGEFAIDLTEASLESLGRRSGGYGGEDLQIDLYCRSVPGQRAGVTLGEVQFTLGRFALEWVRSQAGAQARVELTVPRELWRDVRTALDAWSISGRVATLSSSVPLGGLRVFAYDKDLVHDDPLGSGTTDQEGAFRIDFSGSDFRNTPSGIVVERNGPDLYFRIEAPDGRLLLDEDRTRADAADRRDVQNLFTTELIVEI